MEQLKASLASVVAGIPVVVAALFLAGSTSSGAFVRDLGLSGAQFPSSFEWTVLGGFTTLFVFGFVPALYFLGAISVASLIVVLTVQTIRARSAMRLSKARSQVQPSTRQKHQSATLDALERFFDRAGDGAAIGVALIVAVIVLILASRKAGQTAADEFKKKAASGEAVVSQVHLKPPSGDIVSGVLAACSDTQCAYWFRDHSVIINMNDVDRVVVRPVAPASAPSSHTTPLPSDH